MHHVNKTSFWIYRRWLEEIAKFKFSIHYTQQLYISDYNGKKCCMSYKRTHYWTKAANKNLNERHKWLAMKIKSICSTFFHSSIVCFFSKTISLILKRLKQIHAQWVSPLSEHLVLGSVNWTSKFNSNTCKYTGMYNHTYKSVICPTYPCSWCLESVFPWS